MQTPVLPLFLSETATLTQASRKLSLGWSVRKTKRFTHFWLSKVEEFRWQIFPRKQLKKRSCEPNMRCQCERETHSMEHLRVSNR